MDSAGAGSASGFRASLGRPAPCGGSRKLLWRPSAWLCLLRPDVALLDGCQWRSAKGRNALILPSQVLPRRQGAGFDSMSVRRFVGQIVPGAGRSCFGGAPHRQVQQNRAAPSRLRPLQTVQRQPLNPPHHSSDGDGKQMFFAAFSRAMPSTPNPANAPSRKQRGCVAP